MLQGFSTLYLLICLIAQVRAVNEFTSVIDILSANVEFSTFLRLVQRNGYVNYLNELHNFTLFAPINSAYLELNLFPFDIENYILHGTILNSVNIPIGSSIFPFKDNRFIRTINKSSSGEIKINDASFVDKDLVPNFQRAIIHGIDRDLFVPENVTVILDELSLKRSLDFDITKKIMNSIPIMWQLIQNQTFLVLSDGNFQVLFDEIEIKYLTDAFDSYSSQSHSGKRRWYHNRLAVMQSMVCSGIIGGHAQNEIIQVTNQLGQTLNFEFSELGSSLKVNSSDIALLTNVPSENGILHIFDSIHYVKDAIVFDAESYLHGLNKSSFVKELYFRKLERFIKDTEGNYTIFVPEQQVDGNIGFTKPTLLYHFTEQKIDLEEEFPLESSYEQYGTTSKIFNSSFCSSNGRLGGNCQRLKISKTRQGYFLNDKNEILNTKPYRVANTLIYIIDADLHLPGELPSVILQYPSCSQSLRFLRKLGLMELEPNHNGYTVLLPCFDSWNILDLTFDYFKSNKTAIDTLMRTYIIHGLIYTDLDTYDRHTTNLRGEDVAVSFENFTDDNTVALHMSTLTQTIELQKNGDLFFNQGVVHPISEVHLPNSIEITMEHLIRAAGTEEFIHYLERFEEYSKIIADGSHSLLLPTSDSLKAEHIYSNYTNMKKFIGLHLVPQKYTLALLQCDGGIGTFLGSSLSCREINENRYLKVFNGQDKEVRVLKKGCASAHNNSCVFLIDRPISLNWIDHEKYRLTLPAVSLGLGILIGMMLIGLLFFILIFASSDQRGSLLILMKQKLLSQDDQSQSLLNENETTPSHNTTSNGTYNTFPDGGHGRFESAYSQNSSAKPIQMPETQI